MSNPHGASQRQRNRASVCNLAGEISQFGIFDSFQCFDDRTQVRRLDPDSVGSFSAAIVALTVIRRARPPCLPMSERKPIPKQLACDAASSSSGVVIPGGSPEMLGNLTATVKAPLPALT